MHKDKGLTCKVYTHLTYALLIAGFICVLIGISLWVYSNNKLSTIQSEVTSKQIKRLLIQIQHQWQTHADSVASNIKFMRLLEGADRWVRLRSYIVSQGEGLGFDALEVYDMKNRRVFSASFQRDWSNSDFKIEDAKDWLFIERDNNLYRVFDVPVWFGKDGTGHMLLYKRIDNGLLSMLAQASMRLFLVNKKGITMASSEGIAMLGKRPPHEKGLFPQLLRPELYVHIDIGSGIGASILAIAPLQGLQNMTFYILIALSFLLILLLALWFSLGRWLTSLIKRLTSLAEATRRFEDTHVVDEAIRNKLKTANREADEITQLQSALLDLMNTSMLRDKERSEYEKNLHDTITALERTNRELTQFAYIASHDLQEPLRTIAGFSQLLEKRYKDSLGSEGKEFIDYITDGVIRMQMMINDLLAYSRLNSKDKVIESVDCNEVMQRAISNLNSAITEKGAKVTHDRLPVVKGDKVQILQLFQHLINNGIKYNDKQTPKVHVTAYGADGQWYFSFTDNGIGIEPQYYERIFNIFYRLHSKDKYPGTGIGLALCRRIVESHGGSIWVDSQVGKGSVFYFTIPKK